MTIAYRNEEMLQMVNRETGTVDRRIFSDQEIYELELERIFARAWSFMCHDSQIPNPGDFFQTVIGEDRVICVRDNDGMPQVLVNTCRHRGNAICRADEGHATSFMCTYHGWTYDLKGALVGVPGFKEVYHEELDRENWGLIKAAKVDSYHGFIFATMDPEAPELDDYLGEVGQISLDQLASRGDIEIIGGIQKYTIQCNWKLATDNVWDFYHPQISHSSASMARRTPGFNRYDQPHLVMLGEYGHANAGPEVTEESRVRSLARGQDMSWRDEPRAKEALGPVGSRVQNHPNIFPNCWIAFPGEGQISMRMPKGPSTTEIWWFTFNDPATPLNKRALETFGPAGLLEQDDGENWGESTRGMKGVISKRYPINYSMGLGHGEVIDDETGPPHIESTINEHPQLWLYRAWSEWMAADSWSQLRESHSPVPEDRV